MFRSLVGLGVLLLAVVGVALAAEGAYDWRKSGSEKEKMKNLVKAMPSASQIMMQAGERYKSLYWAAKQEQWDFAEYQIEELEELMTLLQVTRPKRAATAQEFLDNGFEGFEQAFEKKEWKAFYGAFSNMREQCMVCHVKNDHAFVVLPKHPKTASSPVLNLDEDD